MARRARPDAPGSALVAWGWYAVTTSPLAPDQGGSEPGLVPRLPEGRAFWAAWWTSDPRREYVDPDDFGFVEGAPATISGEAITVADRRVREAMGPRVFARSVGEPLARQAYREGAPQRRATTTDFEAIAAAWLVERGLPPTADVFQIKRAWRDFLKAEHSGEGAEDIDLDAERKRYEAALAGAQARAATKQRADVAAGKVVDDRPAIKKAKRIARDVRERLDVIARCLGAAADLTGLCHFAAAGLVAALKAEGLRGVLATQGGHSFAHVLLDAADEPMLLDVTASQYGLAAVYVRLPGQKRRWMHDAKLKGARALQGAQEVAAIDVLDAPERWWTIAPAQLPAELAQHGTRLERLKSREPSKKQLRAIATGKLNLDAPVAPAPGSAARSPLEAAIAAAVKCVKCKAALGGCDCWIKCTCGWSFEKGEACRNPVHVATTQKRRGRARSSRGAEV